LYFAQQVVYCANFTTKTIVIDKTRQTKARISGFENG
jgi:hypothetical protein